MADSRSKVISGVAEVLGDLEVEDALSAVSAALRG